MFFLHENIKVWTNSSLFYLVHLIVECGFTFILHIILQYTTEPLRHDGGELTALIVIVCLISGFPNGL